MTKFRAKTAGLFGRWRWKLASVLQSILYPVPCRCPVCRRWWLPDVRSRRMSTAYVHDPSNWTYSCTQCYLEIEEHWKEMWAQYYAERL